MKNKGKGKKEHHDQEQEQGQEHHGWTRGQGQETTPSRTLRSRITWARTRTSKVGTKNVLNVLN
jgi:hypothetical protein